MTTLSFAKLHGTANDFIYVDAREGFPGDPAAPAPRLCARRRRHPVLPRRGRAGFGRVGGRGRLVRRVWERGAGESMACGRGACGVAVAAARTGRAARRAVVALPGGELEIDWRDDDRVLM